MTIWKHAVHEWNQVWLKDPSTKKMASIIPAKIATLPTPRLEIPAQIWIFRGCLARPTGRGSTHHRWNESLAELSTAIVLSPVKMTSSKFSFVALQRWQYSSHLTLLASRTNWQYFVPVDNYSSFRRTRFIVASEIFTSKVSATIFTRSVEVVSSFLSIALSTNSRISGVCLVNRRAFILGTLNIPVVSYRRINLERCWRLMVKLSRFFKSWKFRNPSLRRRIISNFNSNVTRGMLLLLVCAILIRWFSF